MQHRLKKWSENCHSGTLELVLSLQYPVIAWGTQPASLQPGLLVLINNSGLIFRMGYTFKSHTSTRALNLWLRAGQDIRGSGTPPIYIYICTHPSLFATAASLLKVKTNWCKEKPLTKGNSTLTHFNLSGIPSGHKESSNFGRRPGFRLTQSRCAMRILLQWLQTSWYLLTEDTLGAYFINTLHGHSWDFPSAET